MYSDFALIYDQLMNDIDYAGWTGYIEEIFKANHIEPSLILDLGCGTGSFCMEMAKRGYDLIGVDISAEMLSHAKQKSASAGLDILFLNQDMTRFELYGTVDTVVCLLDSLNYIKGKTDAARMFKLVNNYHNPGGLFIFDVNSIFKFEKVLASNVFYDVEDNIAYIWQNNYDGKKKLCEFDLTFFTKDGEFYRRYDEIHIERAYSACELEEMARKAGLEVLNVYDALTFSPPRAESERLFFVCRKPA
jgi:SAM-dependent methyltransferase